jgi:hypothetical protein
VQRTDSVDREIEKIKKLPAFTVQRKKTAEELKKGKPVWDFYTLMYGDHLRDWQKEIYDNKNIVMLVAGGNTKEYLYLYHHVDALDIWEAFALQKAQAWQE